MKNKKSTYILLFTVAVIWGTVAYRIISHIRKPDQVGAGYFTNTDPNKNYFEKDTVILLKLDYPDPFLKYNHAQSFSGYSAKRSASNASIGQRINPNINQPVEIINWPEIKFNGIILNNKTSEKLGLLEMRNESFLVKKGDERFEVRINEIYPDSIKLIFKNQARTFIKTK
jgi:hypothetical protein